MNISQREIRRVRPVACIICARAGTRGLEVSRCVATPAQSTAYRGAYQCWATDYVVHGNRASVLSVFFLRRYEHRYKLVLLVMHCTRVIL